jgi:hypothetical protein
VQIDRLSYEISARRLTVVVRDLTPGETYTYQLLDTITDDALNQLDGEFDGYAFPTRDGSAGGTFSAAFDAIAVTRQPPVITNLTAETNPVARPAAVRLVAEVERDPDGVVLAVTFYRDSNGDGQWDEGDEVLGAGVEESDGWSWTANTAGWPLGEQLLFARAQDDADAWSEAASVLVTLTSWQNPDSPFDVAGDGNVEAHDVLLLVNQINYNGGGLLPLRTADDQHLPYFDVNGDGSLTPLDALMVITHINLQGDSPAASDGEGEALLPKGDGGWRPSNRVMWELEQRESLTGNPPLDDPPIVDVAAAPVPLLEDLHQALDLEERPSAEDWETLLDDVTLDLAGLGCLLCRTPLRARKRTHRRC